MKKSIKQVYDWMFRDSNGNIVIAQTPNWPLYLVIGFFLLKFIPIEALLALSLWGGRVSLLYWAYLEISQGVNGFRKLLGGAVALWLLTRIIVNYQIGFIVF